MKHFEFQTYVTEDEKLTIPTDVAVQIERDHPVRVIILLPDNTESREWSDLSATQFIQGYADTDAIYDDVSSG